MDEITVIIPVYNQAFPLSLTLYGFTRQTPPFNKAHIIVIDDGSTEPVSAIVEAYSKDLNLSYIRIAKGGRAKARNHGIKHVKDGMIIFNDADRIPRSDFVKAHYEAYKKLGDNFVIIGQVRDLYLAEQQNRKYILDRFEQKKWDRIPQYCRLVYQLYNKDGNTQSSIAWLSTFSGNLSISKATLNKIGFFDEGFKEWGFEHFELGFRAYMYNQKFYYQREAQNVHLAHPRRLNNYIESMKESHHYFYQKHNKKVVKHLLDFMLGKMSLEELEHIGNFGYTIEDSSVNKSFVKITNF
ncbi:glycosyltransferase [Bacillus sp. 166amftsu]|uniref:glycosyltransferase n=1 Tax=Bacillus sp. 166amftsu TaxID=1761753 RepID=UPI000898FFCC|nr:glycosyltransferase [Bacillus sp. 166amftsu]SDZ40614.1 Glycosyltransferase, GT2 family [Bacillus sp. 166amftsu]